MNSRLQSTIILHNALHGFIQGEGTGTEIVESKLEQKLVGIVHEPLFQVFVDAKKAYESLDRGILMGIIRGGGLVPKLQRILQRYWDGEKVVLKAGKFFGRPFNT